MKYEHGFPESAEIVVIDDEDQNLYLFKDTFGDFFNLKLFQDPYQAQNYLYKNLRVLLVITDQSMPGKTGLEVAQLEKEHKPYLNFIMTTANPKGDKDLMYKSLKKKLFYDFLQKPIDLEENKDQYKWLFVDAMVDSFRGFMKTNYCLASETFSATPITLEEIEQFEKLLKVNFSNDLKIESSFTEIEIFKKFNDIYMPIAILKKNENSSWSFMLKQNINMLNIGVPDSIFTQIGSKTLVDLFNVLLHNKNYVDFTKALKAG